MTRRALLAIFSALVGQATTATSGALAFPLPKDFTVSIDIPLIIRVDGQEFRYTPHALAQILKGDA